MISVDISHYNWSHLVVTPDITRAHGHQLISTFITHLYSTSLYVTVDDVTLHCTGAGAGAGAGAVGVGMGTVS